MSNKDYKHWHNLKTDINNLKGRPFFYEREVWFSNLGLNVGNEEDGKGSSYLRPIVIVKKFNNDILWGIPTTRKNGRNKFYFNFEYKNGEFTNVILSQLRLIDSKRLQYRIGFISEQDFIEIKRRIRSFLK